VTETVRQKNRLDAFLTSVGYPERAPGGAVSFALRVDDMEVLAEAKPDGRIVLSYVVSEDESAFPALAGFVAGRMLREDAVLSCDARGAFLWQDAPVDADAHDWTRLFETFADSCDWWRERAEGLRGSDVFAASGPEMVIRP